MMGRQNDERPDEGRQDEGIKDEDRRDEGVMGEPAPCFQRFNPRALCSWGCRDDGRGYDGIQNGEK